jgi:putative membrane protein
MRLWVEGGRGMKNDGLAPGVPNLFGISTAAAVEGPYGPWMGHPMWGVWGFGMMFVSFIFWGLIVVGLIFAIRWFAAQAPRGGPPQPGQGETALEILKKRYARGEIDKEEFEAKKRDLS